MSRITRDSFIGTLSSSSGGEGLDLDTLDAPTARALDGAGISADTLASLAGDGHHVATHDELGRLFDLIDRVDHDGHFTSIETTHTTDDGRVLPTASGAVFTALTDQLERARLGAPPTVFKAPDTGPVHEVARPDLAAAGFTDVRLTKVTYDNQAQKPWGLLSYPSTPAEPGANRTIANSGCAPTSIAMMDAALRGTNTKPNTVAAFAVQHGLSGAPGGGGTNTGGLALAWAKNTGLSLMAPTSSDRAKNVDVLAAGLRAGGVAVVSMGVDSRTHLGHFAETHANGAPAGHVVVINGCATRGGEEWFAVTDPGRHTHEGSKAGLLGLDDTVTQLRGGHNGDGNLWISRSQLEAEMKRCYVFSRGAES